MGGHRGADLGVHEGVGQPVGVVALGGLAEAARGLLDGPEMGLPDPEMLLADIDPLLAAFTAMRQAEGAALAAILLAQIDHIATLVDQANALAAARAQPQAARLRMAAQSLLEGAEIDEARLLQEIATLALKTDVTEEIDRLRAHVTAARALLAQGALSGASLIS